MQLLHIHASVGNSESSSGTHSFRHAPNLVVLTSHFLQATGEREIKSRVIGEQVMSALRKIDEVAYVRFASVYRRFKDLNEFRLEIDRLESDEQSPR